MIVTRKAIAAIGGLSLGAAALVALGLSWRADSEPTAQRTALPSSVAEYLWPTPTPVGGVSPETGTGGGAANPTGPGPVAASYESTVQRRHYVDCTGGNDSNDGSATGSAWRTLKAVSGRTFRSGDGIYLRSGCSFDGGVVVNGSGANGAPILVTLYGGSDRPWVSNSGGGTYGVAVTVNGSYVVVDGLGARNAHFAGVQFNEGTSHGIAQNLEITGVGMGVILGGSFDRVTHTYAHDLKMVANTPKSQNPNDDYGAVGFVVNGTDNEVSWSRCTNCQAPSYDYGMDGGFVEVWNSGDRLYVHHNVAVHTNGFFELGAQDSSHHANDVRVAYNLLDETGVAVNVNRNNLYGISVTNFRFENNTSVRSEPGYQTIIFPSVRPQDLILRNNIFWMESPNLVFFYGGGTFTHQNNLFHKADGAKVNFTLDPTDKLLEPRFVSVEAGDFRLTASSPALDAGKPLGYTTDLDGKPVDAARPSMGAYEG